MLTARLAAGNFVGDTTKAGGEAVGMKKGETVEKK
jgi:hypothetical protein